MHSVSFLKKIQVKASKKCAITTDIRCNTEYVIWSIYYVSVHKFSTLRSSLISVLIIYTEESESYETLELKLIAQFFWKVSTSVQNGTSVLVTTLI